MPKITLSISCLCDVKTLEIILFNSDILTMCMVNSKRYLFLSGQN